MWVLGVEAGEDPRNAKSGIPEPVGICTNRRPFAPTGGHPGLTLTGWCFYTSLRGYTNRRHYFRRLVQNFFCTNRLMPLL